MKTQNQERAKFVINNIERLKKSNYTEKVSSYILTNGLLPTLAFLKSKDEKVYNVFNERIGEIIFQDNRGDIIEKLVNSDAKKLRTATIEAMELSNWMRRLVKCEGEIGGN